MLYNSNQMSIAIQGIEGSFHHAAAEQFFGPTTEIEPHDTFRQVFQSVAGGNTSEGVVAIENSLHGSINPVYRLLAEYDLRVVGEVRLQIELFLIGLQSSAQPLEQIDSVISQGEALSQCEDWLDAHLPKARREEFHDTAASVRHVVQTASLGQVAIASKQAAQLHGGTIFAGPINDDPANYTRFFVIRDSTEPVPNADRTSIIISEKESDQVGTLHRALGIFASRGINLSKIDSHTLSGKDRRYAFYIDFDESSDSYAGLGALEGLDTHGWDVQNLGSYKRES